METLRLELTESELAELREAARGDVSGWIKRVALDRARRREAVRYSPQRETRGTS